MAIKRMIWTSEVDISEEAIQAFAKELKIQDAGNCNVIQAMYDGNGTWLNDERRNLDIATRNPILVIADLGLWNGRRLGYKVLGTLNVNAIFGVTCGDTVTFYADAYNVQCDDVHHDGTNHYIFRELIGDEEECAPLLNAIYEGKNIGEIKAKIRRYSRSLLPYVADVYGWPVAGRRKEVA